MTPKPQRADRKCKTSRKVQEPQEIEGMAMRERHANVSKQVESEDTLRNASRRRRRRDATSTDAGQVTGLVQTEEEIEEVCSACEFGGAEEYLLLCDGRGCPNSFHTFCLRPPLQKIPDGEWLCPLCRVDSEERALKDSSSIALECKQIEAIMGSRENALEGDEVTNVMKRLEYLVKWRSLSHYHDIWVPEEWLLFYDRARLFGFQRKLSLDQPTTCTYVDERRPEWFEIERIIACSVDGNKEVSAFSMLEDTQLEQFGNKKIQYLVKWVGLDYDGATWEEDGEGKDMKDEIRKFFQRHKKARCGSKLQECISLEGNIKEQPSYLSGGVLFNFQLQGLKWLISNFEEKRSVILADEMGLGKTIQAAAFLVCIKHEGLSCNPTLIVAPKSTLPGWQKELWQWASEMNVVLYQGDKEARSLIRKYEFYTDNKTLFDVLVTSYELAMLDSAILQKFRWSCVIVDEGHRIKNVCSKLIGIVKHFRSEFRLLLTGTPIQNTLTELFTLLHFLDPIEFPNPKNAALDFAGVGVDSNNIIKDPNELKKQVARIHDLLKPRMLRRLKTEVFGDMLPGKKLVEIPCALTPIQRYLYVNLLKKNYRVLNKGVKNGLKRSLNSLLTDLKMCCNHPFLFPGQEPPNVETEEVLMLLVQASGKLQILQKLLPRLREDGHRVLLFSQMTKMLDILEDFLNLEGYSFCRLDGSTSTSDRSQLITEFNGPGSSTFVFLISTRAGGLGINLPSADTVVIFDPDFNPFIDLQAQSRAHRIGQERVVLVFQLITVYSIEEKILQRCRKKLALENLVMTMGGREEETTEQLQRLLLHGAEKILNENDLEATSINYTDEDITHFLSRDITECSRANFEDFGYLGAVHGEEGNSTEKQGGKWEELLGGMVEESNEELGRGKRIRKVVSYDIGAGSDEDDAYEPSEGSSSSSSDSSTNVWEPGFFPVSQSVIPIPP